MTDNLASVAERARRLLSEPEDSIDVLRIHEFQDDLAAHDDSLQERLEREFTDAFEAACGEIDEAFGEPTRVDGEDVAIPLCGVFRSATWIYAGRTLYVVAACEDREAPYLLVLGTA